MLAILHIFDSVGRRTDRVRGMMDGTDECLPLMGDEMEGEESRLL